MLLDQEHTEDAAYAAAWKKLEAMCALTERLVAVIPFPWYYARVKFMGKGTRKQAFELLDEILCGLLLVRDGISGVQIRELLGLQDDLGERVFERMVKPLHKNMIEGDDSYYALSDQGRTYAKSGSKFKGYQDPFEIIVDMNDIWNPEAKVVHATVGKTKLLGLQDSTEVGIMGESLREHFDDITTLLPYVQAQCSNMHLPEKGFYLQEASLKETRLEAAQLWVGVFEDWESNTCHYEALVQENLLPVPSLSKILSDPKRGDLQERVAAVVAQQYPSELVDTEKPVQQTQEEQWLLTEVSAANTLPDEQQVERKVTILEERKNFSTQAFEDEIEELSKICKSELWIISPWIKEVAFDKRRVQIERLLRNGCKVFIGYSAAHEAGKEMVSARVLGRLRALQQNYPQLFVAELPQFHEKIMFAELGNGKRYEYTGSFNVLSFAVGRQEKIGRENMRRLRWGGDSQHNYEYQLQAFLSYYQANLEGEMEALMPGIANERAAIASFQKQVMHIERSYDGFFEHVGNVAQQSYLQGMEAAKARLQVAKRKLILEKLAEDRQILDKSETLTPNAARNIMQKATDRIKEIGLAPTLVADEVLALEQICQTKVLRFELEGLANRIETQATEWIDSDKTRYEKEQVRLLQTYPHADQGTVATLLASIQSQLLDKSGKIAIKVVGKIDLPPTPSRKGNKKNNKKKR